MAPTTASQPVAAASADAAKKDRSHKKDKKAAVVDAAVAADDADADAVAEELDAAEGETDAAKKDRKREKKERKERERLEREQAEKDAATVAAASAAQAVSAVASATRLPIDPSLDGSFAAAENTALDAPVAAAPPAAAVPEQSAVTQPTQVATNAAAPAVGTSAPVDPVTGEPIKRKRGRPKKDPNAPPTVKKPKRDAGENGSRRGRRPKMSEEAAIEELKGLSRRELLVERVYSSDMLAKLERTIGLKYQKGRFTTEEQDIIKNGIAEFMKLKNLNEEDFQELLYNYREKGWERMYTELWKDLAGRLDGRPNIAVRLHVRTNKSQFRRQGRYTLAEDFEIRNRMGVLREDAASVAKRLGRLNQDVLSRFVKLQVRDEMAEGPTWTAEEDKAVIAALEQYKQEHPGEVISWKAIANMMGNKRSYKVYSNLFSNIRSRVDRSGLNPKRDYGTSLEDAAAAASQQAVRGIQRHPTRAELDNSVWIPGEDDLILLQRLNFQDTFTEASVRWGDLSFDTWQWPEEALKQQFAQIKSRYLPEGFSGGWQETLDKIIRTIRTRRTKKEIDDEGEDQRETAGESSTQAAAAAETPAAAPAAAPEAAPAAIDPALDASVAEPASTTA
ncbi:Nucleolar protein [Pseudozyma hubeiensis]|nr:Nucleolar protein [Pseudozyma hubeiensis]